VSLTGEAQSRGPAEVAVAAENQDSHSKPPVRLQAAPRRRFRTASIARR
jgi:hypothetical protein